MHRRWSAIVIVSAVLAAPAARAQAVAARQPRFPIAVRLVVPPDALASYHNFAGMQGRLNPSARVPIGEQARDAYAFESGRMFASAAPGAAELVISVAWSDVDLDPRGWFAWVEHDVVLRAASGDEVARWRVRGEGRIEGLGERAVPAAFRDAAAYAARTFSAEFEAHPGARAWLAAAGVSPSPGTSAPIAPPRLTPAPVAAPGPRARELLFADVGGSAIGAGGGAAGGLSARAGWTRGPWLLQLAIDFWQRPFTPYPNDAWGSGEGELSTLAFGLDAGAQWRLGSRLELYGGAGAAALRGRAVARYTPMSAPLSEAEASATASGFTASAFAGARFNAVLPRIGIRYRLGAEVRRRFGATLDVPAFGREVAVADLSVGVFAGLELPLRQ